MKFETPERMPVERLRLDRRSPRLVGEDEATSDEALVARLYRRYDLEELLLSISANGYMDIEPLVATVDAEDTGANGDLTVLEGNRRLAAVRLLRDPELVDRIRDSEGLHLPVPPMDPARRNTLDSVTVYPVASREDARSFIGFKHINGAAKWNAYAKSRFAAEWYRSGRGTSLDLAAVSDAIGDKFDTLKRMVTAIHVLDQAKREGLYDIEDRATRQFGFSRLYVALSRSEFMDYLGLRPGRTRNPTPDPVPKERFDELRKALVWIFGSAPDGTRSVIGSQNPDIERLGEVLAHPRSVRVLDETGSLYLAHKSVRAEDRELAASLVVARDNLRTAVGLLRSYDGQDRSILDIAEDMRETATTVHRRVREKRQTR